MLGAPWAYPQPSDPSFENCRSCRKPPHRWPCPSQGSQHPMTALLGNIKARLPQRAFKDLRDDGLPPAPPRGSSLYCSWATLQPNPGPAQGHAPHSWSRPLFLIELLEESSRHPVSLPGIRFPFLCLASGSLSSGQGMNGQGTQAGPIMVPHTGWAKTGSSAPPPPTHTL